MNADRLLALYDRVSGAPDAVPRLRRFVLDLAVRGRLVEQIASEGEGAALLPRIAKAWKDPRMAGKFKKTKILPAIGATTAPFEIPGSWSLVPLGAAVVLINGRAFKPIEWSEKGLPIVRIQNLNNPLAPFNRFDGDVKEKFLIVDGDLLISWSGTPGTSFGAHIWSGGPAVLNQHIFKSKLVNDVFDKQFLKIAINARLLELIEQAHGGVGLQHITKPKLEAVAITLPPRAEQRRIVARVDELMAIYDRLEKARTVREDTRDRLTKVSYARMSVSDANHAAFRTHARFAVDALPALTARSDQVKHVRQSILDLAVRGKLVEQDPADEPPARLDPAIPHDLAPPFPVPPNWRWSRLHALGMLKGGGTPSKARDDFWNGSIPWVSPKDMKVDYIAETRLNITEAAITGSAAKLIEAESILFVVRGMILSHSFPVAISRVPLTINQDMKAITLKNPEMAEYLLRSLKGLRLQVLTRVKRSSHGTCRIEGRDYRDFMIPLPPLAEQRRIVTKVDELMALCDRLELSLSTVENGRHRLLELVLREALKLSVKAMEAA